jgi:hypothetical protein
VLRTSEDLSVSNVVLRISDGSGGPSQLELQRALVGGLRSDSSLRKVTLSELAAKESSFVERVVVRFEYPALAYSANIVGIASISLRYRGS